MSELLDFASVPFHILTPKDAKPIIEIIQDTMVGSFRITKAHTRIHEKAYANLQMVNSYFNGILPLMGGEGHTFTGRQAFSAILPPSLFINNTNKAKERVTIYNSELTEGFIDKGIFSDMSRGLLPVIFHDFGPFEVRRFMDNLQRLICRWLMTAGFSVGISDLAVSEEIQSELKMVISSMKADAYKRLDDVRLGRMENTSMFNNQDHFEREIMNILNDSMKKAGSIGLRTIDDSWNRLINMVKSGSKGKDLNVSQMIAAVGQQNVDGKRVAYGFTDRTLPHFCKYDDGPEARGFVESSFISGLTPQELFFHAMGGREGLIDTAVKSVTPETPIVIIEDGVSKYVKIGEWIDAHLESNPEAVKHFPQDRNMELLDLDTTVWIPTTDDDGNVTWGQLTAVTRHDVGKDVYKVKTLGGREAIIADSETLLIYKKGKFLKMKTSQVEVGFIVPVTMNLPEPPVVVTHFDMAEYFPKTEYVHGSEYNRAVALMKEAQGDKFHIPRGWWELNNGKTFTTPYPSKALLQRAIVRSNVENIHDGCIYPYHAKRDRVRLPDKFKLDYDNGVFIGLYLADGCAHEVSGKVSICKEDPGIQTFVKNWFAKFNIKADSNVQKKEAHDNFGGGFTYTVDANSTLLVRFLHSFVGTLAHNKHVPDVAFAAPLAFVKGIISGYFSGDGCVQKGGIEASSVSHRLIEGISMLCSRIGIFGKVSTTQVTTNNLGTINIRPVHHITIRSHWAEKFANEIELVMKHKDESMKNNNYTNAHRNFDYQNDVVMDQIVEIYKVDAKAYPKLYDVTVPSTLNFGTANGLQWRDTSETGYIQRRLIKAMEDAKIYYDQTVRNASGTIMQFLYGEDGMEGTKIEKQVLPTMHKTVFELDKDYHLRTSDPLDVYLTKEAVAAMREEGNWSERADAHFEQILQDRAYLLETVLKGERQNTLFYPIPFERILKNAQERSRVVGISDTPTDLTPTVVFDAIDALVRELYVTKPKQGTFYIELLVRAFLSPKPLIMGMRMKKGVFEWVVGEVRKYFKEGIAPAGEMVGIIAAQSVGEPLTQLSCAKNTLVRCENYVGSIGDFIDSLLTKHASDVVQIGHRSVVLDLKEGIEDHRIVGVSTDEKTSWHRILQVSRHPANGGMVKVCTRSGRETTATLSHSFLKRTPTGIVPVKGSDLKVGDRVPVARAIPTVPNPVMVKTFGTKTIPLDREFGWFIGAYLASAPNCSSFDVLQTLEVEFGTGFLKKLPAWVYASNIDFIRGIVAGVFNSSHRIALNERLLDDVVVLLSYCGVFATKTCDAIQVSRKYAQHLQDTVGQDIVVDYTAEDEADDMIPEVDDLIDYIGKHLGLVADFSKTRTAIGRRTLEKYITLFEAENEKAGKLQDVTERIELLKQAANADVVWDEIVKLEYTPDPQEYVYDFTVPGNDSFMVDTGILVHNTLNSFHVSGTAAAVKATSGVPRIKELLSVSKNMKTPSLTIYLKQDIGTVVNPIENDQEGVHADPAVREAKERALQVLRSLETTYLSQVIESSEIYYDPAGEDGFDTSLPDDAAFLNIYRAFAETLPTTPRTSPWVLRMRIDRAKLHAARITMTDAYLRLMAGNAGITCLFSDDNAKDLIMRVSLNEKENDKGDAHGDQVAALKALEQSLIQKPIKGVERIRKVSMHAKAVEHYNPETQGYDKKAEWVLDTDGSNLTEILGNPNVDATRTVTNDPREIFAVLGIEAARISLYKEIMDVINESSVNYRHVSLLIDTMTHRGNLMSIDRHGINRGDVGPLAKSSFEESTDMLINASVFSDFDKINGVSANIMLGQLPPCGTADSDILLDEQTYLDMLSAMKRSKQAPALGVIAEDDENTEATESDVCGYANFQFTYKPIQKQDVGNAYRLPDVDF